MKEFTQNSEWVILMLCESYFKRWIAVGFSISIFFHNKRHLNVTFQTCEIWSTPAKLSVEAQIKWQQKTRVQNFSCFLNSELYVYVNSKLFQDVVHKFILNLMITGIPLEFSILFLWSLYFQLLCVLKKICLFSLHPQSSDMQILTKKNLPLDELACRHCWTT